MSFTDDQVRDIFLWYYKTYVNIKCHPMIIYGLQIESIEHFYDKEHGVSACKIYGSSDITFAFVLRDHGLNISINSFHPNSRTWFYKNEIKAVIKC